MHNEMRILSVSQLSQHIKGLMDRDELLSGVLVRGEISNYKMYPSGHHYFTLKDADSALRCVMFRGDAVRLRFRPENGMQVIAAGRISVFPRDGQYQLYCVSLTPEGAGQLQIAFEQLKNKLQAEGLFDPANKKPLPAYPKRIALVTSSAGAAVRDMLRILKARWPMSRVLIVPVRVQGEQAAEEIAAAIDYVNYYNLGDLIIAGRGGGSVEDLWAFNEEPVARAIFHSGIPVISAVGHEPDVTISDFVADLRAATPSNAAELAVPDRVEVEQRLAQLERRLLRATVQPISNARQRLERLKRSRVLTDPAAGIREKRLLLDYQGSKLLHGMEQTLASQKQRVGRLAAALDALSPLKVLGRGYAIARDEGGRVLTGAEQIEPGDKLDLRLADGILACRVEERKCL
jgi:exodeoxyribonuclease VII large subunit